MLKGTIITTPNSEGNHQSTANTMWLKTGTCGAALYLPVYRLSTASLLTAVACSTTG